MINYWLFKYILDQQLGVNTYSGIPSLHGKYISMPNKVDFIYIGIKGDSHKKSSFAYTGQ